MLANPNADYMRGFELAHARRPAAALAPVAVDDLSDPAADGRIAPVTRLARRFLDAIEQRQPASPGFAEGYRVQYLIDAARRSHDARPLYRVPHMSRILVTGGSGFIGSALVKRLVGAGHKVRVLDDFSRGARHRLAEVAGDVECIAGDIRSADTVGQAAAGVEEIHHLAYVNGTQFFYSAPDLVLDVAVRGMISVIDACRANRVGTLVLASSSEVYQTPPRTPTDETAPLVGAGPAQSALFLRRRQDRQRADGDQLRPQGAWSAC